MERKEKIKNLKPVKSVGRNKMKTVIACGFFNPIHRGHIEYLRLAKQLGDKLIVLVASDEQVELKGRKKFMNQEERQIILGAIKYVDETMICIDDNLSACKTLEMLRKRIPGDLIFAEGGDKFKNTIPEAGTCKKLNIEIIDGLGEKIQHSSKLLNKKEN